MKTPTTFLELQGLIISKIAEDLHLEYKSSAALDKTNKSWQEFSKDVSALANADGGIIVYGMVEKGHLPDYLDNGISDGFINRERLNQALDSYISPTLPGCRIFPVECSADHYFYVVEVEKSFRGPHQAIDKKYYRRRNFQAEPMEHYEIEEARLRIKELPPLVTLKMTTRGCLVDLCVENIGSLPAYDVRFEFRDELKWPDRELPQLFQNGSVCLAPGSRFRFRYASFTEIFNNPDIPKRIRGRIIYKHALREGLSFEPFDIDFSDHYNSLIEKTDAEIVVEGLNKAVGDLKQVVERVAGHLENISKIAGDTGLEVSHRSLMNLTHKVPEAASVIRRSPIGLAAGAFREMLGVSERTSWVLCNHFCLHAKRPAISEADGITEEVISQLEKIFWFDDDESQSPK